MSEVKTIEKMELRERMGEVFYELKNGTTFVITHGQKKTPVAVLSALPGENLTMTVDSKGEISYD